MIEGINDSKKSFFTWLIVFLVLCIGLCVTWTVLNNNSSADEKLSEQVMMYFYLGSFLFSCLPIGWAARRKVIKWYAHVPTEEIKVFETNLPVALFRLIKCTILFSLNVTLFTIYTSAAIIVGPFINLYAIITGIVFMIQKKI